jgi:serine protease
VIRSKRIKLNSLALPRVAIAIAAMTLSAATFTASAAGGNHVTNPYSPAYQHEYRHGVIPTREGKVRMKDWIARTPTMAAATSSNTLYFRGGVGGVGVLSGQAKVYLIYYGNQWGTQTTDANGYMQFTNDSAGAGPAAQKMFKGIGTNNELWSAELTQWCDGSTVATGASVCPSTGAARIPYQQNVLAGVWYDNSAASPASATANQLAAEANKAAAHFGNTTPASNRYTYYVILSPKGTNPDNYKSTTNGYCAWHDYVGSSSYTTPATYGNLAFSNQPYNIDVGSSCGVNFVNSGTAGTLDGYTMTLGHEWHEMMSDQFPAGGWTANSGYENSDECAWIAASSAGGAANVAFSTGTFTQQASWSNDTNACAISHPIVTNGSGGGGGSCGGLVLCSGTAVTLPSVATGGVSSTYTMVVPTGKTSVVFTISGGTGDADMYVKLGSAPTTTSYNCRPYASGNAETCTFNAPTAGTYYVNVRAYAAFSGVSLKGTISP